MEFDITRVIKKPDLCPSCQMTMINEIFYGDIDDFYKVERNNIIYGGETRYRWMPEYICMNCKAKFTTN